MNSNKTPNRLVHATSPYLLQHAYNPVHWFEWDAEALQKAKAEDKPILVSIGYSSCHWCHVMERECFEQDDIAGVMNDFFVCIKVDREERPDIDQIYMEAVQALGLNGGWPLNVFLTPDQNPFYGGTYFPPQNWLNLLQNVHNAYNTNRKDIDASAESLKQHLTRSDVERFKQKPDIVNLLPDIDLIYKKLAQRFDETWGGLDKAPKFVMPSVWLWLLRYYHITKNKKALDQTLLTLKRLAMGGIYDQIGGGFSRYSVDGEWFAPHFEKMLYDNAQLFSLYSEAYRITQDKEFKEIVYQTFAWLQREMTHSNGSFFSALDADSEGEEGRFYVWTQKEFKDVLGTDSELVGEYYSVKETGNWEHAHNILWRYKPDEFFFKENNVSPVEWEVLLTRAKRNLLHERGKRIRPGLDNKIITSWNAMMTCGLLDAYTAFGDAIFLNAAIQNMLFIEKELTEGKTLYRSYKGRRSPVKGFLDDYAYVIQAYGKLYQATFDEQWIRQARALMDETLRQFFDPADGFFHYTGKDSEKLIAHKKEIFDNVIPSSNSIMARNLFHLGILFDLEEWKKIASDMVSSLAQLIRTEPSYMSNWAIAYTEIHKGLAEVVMMGQTLEPLRKEFHKTYQPFVLVMGTEKESNLPLLEGKTLLPVPTIYVCFNKTCKLPVHTVEEAILQL